MGDEIRTQGTTGGDAIGARLNRRAAESAVEAAFSRASHPGEPVSLGVIEMDGFEEWALEHGHGALTALHEQVVKHVSGQLSHPDQVIAGDPGTLLLVLPALPLLEALVLLDRLQEVLGHQRWSIGDTSDELGFSVGVATRQGGDESASELIAAASRSLQQGRRLTVKRHEIRALDDELAELFGVAETDAARSERTSPQRARR